MSDSDGSVEHVFELPDPEALPALDDAALIDAVTGWATVSAAADARKYAALAELQRRRVTGEHAHWAADDWDAAAAEVAAALNVSHGRATGELDLAVTLRDRLPTVAALFLAGQLSARRVWIVDDRTRLVQDPDALAAVDAAIAEVILGWGPLSEYMLTKKLDLLVDGIDPGGVRRSRYAARSREFRIGQGNEHGIADVWGRLYATDAQLLDERLGQIVEHVCHDDPRTVAQRRADALGALAVGADHLTCRCERPDCPGATVDDERAGSVRIHVIAEQAGIESPVDPLLDGEGPLSDDHAAAVTPRGKAGLVVGGGVIPAPLLAELVARGAKVSPVAGPPLAAEERYRPGAGLDRFVRLRDLTCRFPGCHRPATRTDVDHTVAYPAGATHAGNLKCYCRIHHLIKTFWPGWSERQFPDGTVLLTSPTGHGYATRPAASLFFERWPVPTSAPPAPSAPPAAPDPSGRPTPRGADRTARMPLRRRTRSRARAQRIRAERGLNAAAAERGRPPPF